MAQPSADRISASDRSAAVGDFYSEVVGWSSDMANGSSSGRAGVIPWQLLWPEAPLQWGICIAVDDVDRSARRCRELGGSVLAGPRNIAAGRLCIIRDPAGAVSTLYAEARW